MRRQADVRRYFACAPKMVTALVPSDPHLSGHLISYIIALLGVGQIISGPIGNALENYSFQGANAAYGQLYFVREMRKPKLIISSGPDHLVYWSSLAD